MDARLRARRVCAMVSAIPCGRVASYGQIAELAGLPRGARQVGYVLKALEPGHDVPWYRVVRASGQIAFEEDSPAFVEQRDRLVREGVAVRRGRVDMNACRWRPDMDELLWKPTSMWDET